jgi:hypothetical protein
LAGFAGPPPRDVLTGRLAFDPDPDPLAGLPGAIGGVPMSLDFMTGPPGARRTTPESIASRTTRYDAEATDTARVGCRHGPLDPGRGQRSKRTVFLLRTPVADPAALFTFFSPRLRNRAVSSEKVAMPNRTCEGCGEGFWQGQGRPARRCPRCRQGDRYGPAHQALKANSDQAYGQPCTRCSQPMLAGQLVEPDHLDGGGPTDYAGWAHASCNHSAGAAYGNRMRAAAYRAAKGLPASPNGSVMVRQPPPTGPECKRTREERMASTAVLPCTCGRRASRCW